LIRECQSGPEFQVIPRYTHPVIAIVPHAIDRYLQRNGNMLEFLEPSNFAQLLHEGVPEAFPNCTPRKIEVEEYRFQVQNRQPAQGFRHVDTELFGTVGGHDLASCSAVLEQTGRSAFRRWAGESSAGGGDDGRSCEASG
jgi:hypothetical protein